jgi:hypothetical protein
VKIKEREKKKKNKKKSQSAPNWMEIHYKVCPRRQALL